MTLPPGPILWLTGLPASGKTTVARALIAALAAERRVTLHLDSDDLRPFFPGYDQAGRDRFYAALAHLARRGAEGGAIVVVSATASRRAYRDAARAQAPGAFLEVYLTADLALVAARDPKGLYAAARRGEVADLPGVGARYEPPLSPELTLDAAGAIEAHVAALRGALAPST